MRLQQEIDFSIIKQLLLFIVLFCKYMEAMLIMQYYIMHLFTSDCIKCLMTLPDIIMYSIFVFYNHIMSYIVL